MKLELPKNYNNNNPNIIKKIEEDMETCADKGFHYLFQGSVGCGKTYLARIIEYTLVKAEIIESTHYLKSARKIYSSFLETLSSNYTDKGTVLTNLKRSISHSEFLILDDLGDETNTDASHEYFSSALEDRYDYIKKYEYTKSIITTNLKSKDFINAYGSRLFDRITDVYTIMKFKDHSFRQDKLNVVSG